MRTPVEHGCSEKKKDKNEYRIGLQQYWDQFDLLFSFLVYRFAPGALICSVCRRECLCFVCIETDNPPNENERAGGARTGGGGEPDVPHMRYCAWLPTRETPIYRGVLVGAAG